MLRWISPAAEVLAAAADTVASLALSVRHAMQRFIVLKDV
jgi:hypothetical protein